MPKEQVRAEDRRHRAADVQAVAAELVGQRPPRRIVGHALAEERRAQPPGQAVGRRRLCEQVVRQGVALETGRLAEDRLLAVVAIVVPGLELPPGDRAAGECPGRLLDIPLLVTANAECE